MSLKLSAAGRERLWKSTTSIEHRQQKVNAGSSVLVFLVACRQALHPKPPENRRWWFDAVQNPDVVLFQHGDRELTAVMAFRRLKSARPGGRVACDPFADA
jgi:hypothetical protein